MYFIDSKNYMYAVDPAEIATCKFETAAAPPACPASLERLAIGIMGTLHLSRPTTPEDGKRLYVTLLEQIAKLEA